MAVENNPGDPEVIGDSVLQMFLDNSMELQPGQTVHQSLLCVDERASYYLGFSHTDSISINIPGGGIEFLSESQIIDMISRSNGQINIFAHRLCGWGGIKLRERMTVMVNEGPINNLLENKFEEVVKYIERAFNDENFNPQGLIEENRQDLLIQAKQYIKYKVNQLNRTEPSELLSDDILANADLFDWAFVYGEALELKDEILEINENQGNTGGQHKELKVNVLLDDLDSKPHDHNAEDVVVNISKRFLVNRFQIDGLDPFFADVDNDTIYKVLSLIFDIMEGGHSSTVGDIHKAYIMCDTQEQVDILEGLVSSLKKDMREINFYVIPATQ